MNSEKISIDVVIAWVDGADANLNKKRDDYLNLSLKKLHPGAINTRFNNLNEINYCVLSILKFAPFIRKIFIVTDNQDPKITPIVKQYFPDRISDIHIVDHTEIFEGFEAFLPTFNSICISNMLWRIKGLSNKFVYFNDDIFLVRPVNPSVWFKKGHPVLRGKWRLPPFERLLWDDLRAFFHRVRTKTHIEKPPSFQVNQWNAARLFNYKFRYFHSGHTPLALDKKKLEEYFNNNPNVLNENIKYRFRDYSQFNTVALANHMEYKNGNRNIVSSQVIYMKPENRGLNYVERKFNQCKIDEKIIFLCVQSLDLASKFDQNAIFKELNKILKIKIS